MAAAYPSVLVLGTVPSMTWQVARCLRRAGHAALPLRWSGKRLRAPAAADQLRQLCDSQHISKVMGADEDAVLLLAQQARPLQLPVCMVPSAPILHTLADQWNFTRLLSALELPAPDTLRVNDVAELLAAPLVYPVVTKPLDRAAGRAPQLHRSREALARKLARGRLTAPFPLLAQSFVRGWDVGASFLARGGQMAACSVFRHTRRGARTFYPSVRVCEYAACLAAACRYDGAGHVQLRYDPARDAYVILGMRAQFPAALLYAERAGLNYPDLLLRLEQGMPPQPALPRPGRVRLPPYERLITCCLP